MRARQWTELLAAVADTIDREFEDVAGLITEEGSGYSIVEEVVTEPAEKQKAAPAKKGAAKKEKGAQVSLPL